MSIKKKLNRLKPHLSGGNAVKNEVLEPPIKKAAAEVPFAEVWQQNGVRPFYMEEDYCLVRKVVYPLDTKHGKYPFSEFRKAVAAWNESDYHHPLSAANHQPEDLFFFDTETTGRATRS